MLLAVEITMRHVWIALAWIGGAAAMLALCCFLMWLGAAFVLNEIFKDFWRR